MLAKAREAGLGTKLCHVYVHTACLAQLVPWDQHGLRAAVHYVSVPTFHPFRCFVAFCGLSSLSCS